MYHLKRNAKKNENINELLWNEHEIYISRGEPGDENNRARQEKKGTHEKERKVARRERERVRKEKNINEIWTVKTKV